MKFTEFTVDKNIKCLSQRLSKYDVCEEDDPAGKHAKTKFELVFYDKKSNTSLLKCSLNRFPSDWQDAPNSDPFEIRRVSDRQ